MSPAKADGTVLSGHLRLACALQAKLKTVPVRVWDVFPSYLEEVQFIIRSNTDRRQLSKMEIALAFKRLKEIPREKGGAKATRGGDRKSEAAKESNGGKSPVDRTRDAASSMLGVSRDVAVACDTVFNTPGVPENLKAAVNSGKVAPTTAAKPR